MLRKTSDLLRGLTQDVHAAADALDRMRDKPMVAVQVQATPHDEGFADAMRRNLHPQTMDVLVDRLSRTFVKKGA